MAELYQTICVEAMIVFYRQEKNNVARWGMLWLYLSEKTNAQQTMAERGLVWKAYHLITFNDTWIP